MNIVKVVAELDKNPEYHLCRLLVLLNAFSIKDDEAIEGLTKLAKLDFLLRYPVMLEKALMAKGRSTKQLKLEEHEHLSVESEMVRYRFGPWDHRYREFLNTLIAKDLVTVKISGRTVIISLTNSGREIAKQISEENEFEDYYRRSKILKRHFDIQATNLMKFIYTTFPEIISLKSNTAISYEYSAN